MATTGFKLSLAGAKTKPNLKSVGGGGGTNPPPAKRARLSALGEDEAEDDNGGKQEISGWDATAGGAVKLNGKTKKEEDDEKAATPRVIAALPNRNWREEALRKIAEKGRREGEGEADGDEKAKLPNGLNLFAKKEGQGEEAESMAIDSSKDEPSNRDTAATATALTAEQRLENDAINALITGKVPDHTVIPLARTEREAFEDDYREAPAAPTLSEYEATPIDGFGAAMLRGMGWKDGEEVGRDHNKNSTTTKKKLAPPPKEIKARPPLLGIGAKPEAALGLDAAGAKGDKRAAARQAREALSKPAALGITLRNKKTGEYITEEELNKKLEMQRMVDAAGSGSSDARGGVDGESSRRRGKYVRDAYDEDDREEDRRTRRRDKDRVRDRRDDRYDDDRRKDRERDKDKNKDRDRERERERDDDRYPSSSSSSRRYQHRSSTRRRDDHDSYDESPDRDHRDRRRDEKDRNRERDYDSSDRHYSSTSRRRDDRDKEYARSSSRRDDADRDQGRRDRDRDRDRDRESVKRHRDRDRDRDRARRDDNDESRNGERGKDRTRVRERDRAEGRKRRRTEFDDDD